LQPRDQRRHWTVCVRLRCISRLYYRETICLATKRGGTMVGPELSPGCRLFLARRLQPESIHPSPTTTTRTMVLPQPRPWQFAYERRAMGSLAPFAGWRTKFAVGKRSFPAKPVRHVWPHLSSICTCWQF